MGRGEAAGRGGEAGRGANSGFVLQFSFFLLSESLCPQSPWAVRALTEPGPPFSGCGLTPLTKDGVLLTLCSDPTSCAQE